MNEVMCTWMDKLDVVSDKNLAANKKRITTGMCKKDIPSTSAVGQEGPCRSFS